MSSKERTAMLTSYSKQRRRQFLAAAPVLESLLYEARDARIRNHLSHFQGAARSFEELHGVTFDLLAEAVSQHDGLSAIVAGLDRHSRDLCAEAAWHGDALDENPAAGTALADQLDAAADRLRFMLLAKPAQPKGPWLELYRDAAANIALPGIRLRDATQNLNSDYIAGLLTRLGIARPPATKAERVAQWERLLLSSDTYQRVLPTLPRQAVAMLDELVERRRPMPADALGVMTYLRFRRPGGDDAADALFALVQHGLAHYVEYNEEVSTWREVMSARRPQLIARWTAAPSLTAAATAPDQPGVPRALASFDRMLLHLRQRPPEALADGGIGVNTVRKLAKDLDLAAGQVGLYLYIARALGLVNNAFTHSGRGRNARLTWAWSVDLSAFEHLDGASRWQAVVGAWLSEKCPIDATGLPTRYDERGGPSDEHAPTARRQVLRAFESLPADTAYEPTSAVEWLAFAHAHLIDAERAQAIVDGMRLLGLAPPDGPLRLTDAARALLSGEIERMSDASGDDMIVVQADHTVIASPQVGFETLAALERIAALESKAGAQVFRLTDTSIGRALDSGMAATDIEAFLRKYSRTELPQNVLHLIHDVARRHGSLVVTAASTVVYCDDPVRLAAAVAVKAAKLTPLGATVAVSDLPERKVFDALRAKGLMPGGPSTGEPDEFGRHTYRPPRAARDTTFSYVSVGQRDARADAW